MGFIDFIKNLGKGSQNATETNKSIEKKCPVDEQSVTLANAMAEGLTLADIPGMILTLMSGKRDGATEDEKGLLASEFDRKFINEYGYMSAILKKYKELMTEDFYEKSFGIFSKHEDIDGRLIGLLMHAIKATGQYGIIKGNINNLYYPANYIINNPDSERVMRQISLIKYELKDIEKLRAKLVTDTKVVENNLKELDDDMKNLIMPHVDNLIKTIKNRKKNTGVMDQDDILNRRFVKLKDEYLGLVEYAFSDNPALKEGPAGVAAWAEKGGFYSKRAQILRNELNSIWRLTKSNNKMLESSDYIAWLALEMRLNVDYAYIALRDIMVGEKHISMALDITDQILEQLKNDADNVKDEKDAVAYAERLKEYAMKLDFSSLLERR